MRRKGGPRPGELPGGGWGYGPVMPGRPRAQARQAAAAAGNATAPGRPNQNATEGGRVPKESDDGLLPKEPAEEPPKENAPPKGTFTIAHL